MKVTLTHDVWARMRAYVDLCPDEISGLGKVERTDDGFRVVDIALFEQTVSAAHSDITAEALAKFQVELIKAGDTLEDWNFWWHSHAAMNVFFSGTDTSTIDSSTDFRYLVSLVTNHRHEFVARVDIFDPVRLHAELDVEIEEEENQAIIDACQAEIDAKVSRHVRHTPKYQNNHYGRPYTGMGYHHGQPRLNGFSQADFTGRTVEIEDDTSIVDANIDSVDELEKALEKVGTDDYALAIDVWETMVEEAEVELDFYTNEYPDKKRAKKARKTLQRLKTLGKEYSLDIDAYAT